MHWTLLITIDSKHASSGLQARTLVHDQLAANAAFCTPGSAFGITDWFVIGGRATGMLSEITEPKDAVPQAASGLKVAAPTPLSERDPYDDLGYEDDALLVDERLYRRFLRPLEGKTHHYDDPTTTPLYLDLDGEPVSPDFIGRKWLVVVDCHS